MKHLFTTLFCLAGLGFCIGSQAQVYDDYIGAGHNEGITVTTSSDHYRFGWSENATGGKTLDGSGLDAKLMEASRFLTQAAMGGDREEIEQVMQMGMEAWIDNQFELSSPTYVDRMAEIMEQQLQIHLDNGGIEENFNGPFWQHFQNTFWQTNLTNEDLLRQRMGLVLSEIFVVSFNSTLENFTEGTAGYYDLLLENAFGNYEELLMDVVYSPAMGVYLSHFNNPLEIPEANIHPDENFAREIMQLFSIGLYEMNMDGSYILDGDGNRIPTYNLADVKELAKVFTGLSAGAVLPNEWQPEPQFSTSIWITDMHEPMAMYDDWHSPGPKTLPDGSVIPAGQSGVQDIQDAVSWLVNHQNVAPFMARRLIQQLVKSNPTPGYIQRVANAFADNGEGVRGDMRAVIKAVLLDEEARDCDWIQDPIHGKLREAMQANMHFVRGNNIIQEQGYFWNQSWSMYQLTDYAPMSAPTVFNFYTPDFQPNGDIKEMDLVGPEFQLHNSRTALGYVNLVDEWTNGYQVWYSWADIEDNYIDMSQYSAWAREPEVLINELDILFTHGQLTDETRAIILETLQGINNNEFGSFFIQYRVQMALYLLFMSPDYMILK